MSLTFWQLLALFSLGFGMCVFVLLAVGLGAFVVFRTKRETAEPILAPRQQAGDAGPVDGAFMHESEDRGNAFVGQSQEDLDFEPPMGGDVDKLLYGEGAGTGQSRFIQQFQSDVSSGKFEKES